MEKTHLTFLLFLLLPSFVQSTIVYDTTDKLANSPLSSMYATIVILKDDDWALLGGEPWESQKEWLNTVLEHNAKASLGVIASGNRSQLSYVGGLYREHPDQIEFFCHGFYHRKDESKNQTEFMNAPIELQNLSLVNCNEVLLERIGIRFSVFGAPYNAMDNNTMEVLKENNYSVVFHTSSIPGNLDGDLFWIKIDWGDAGNDSFQSLQPTLDLIETYSNETLFVVQTHSWRFSKYQIKVFGEFIDHLIKSEGGIFMTAVQYHKWILDRDNIVLYEVENKHVLDMSKTSFDHQITFDLSGQREITIHDVTKDKQEEYEKTNGRIVFTANSGHVYVIKKTNTIHINIIIGLLVLLIVYSIKAMNQPIPKKI